MAVPGKLGKGTGWAGAGHTPEKQRIWEQWGEKRMCRDECAICVVLKVQAASSKLRRAVLLTLLPHLASQPDGCDENGDVAQR